jgi:PUA-domain protein
MRERHRRYFMKAKESRQLLDDALKRFKLDPTQIQASKVRLEVVETSSGQVFLLQERPILAKVEDRLFPTLTFKEFFEVAPKVVVDMGAVPYVCKGANVMAPGIRRFEGDFEQGDTVSIVDERHGKPIAVGEIIYEKEKAKSTKEGIVVKTVHFVGDKTWNSLKEISRLNLVKP